MSEEPKPKWLKVENEELHSVVPDELWLRFLGYLSMMDICSVGATSRRYNKLSKDPSLWKDLELISSGNIERDLEHITKVLERATMLEKLRFTNDGYGFNKVLDSVVEHAKDSLKVLILEPKAIPNPLPDWHPMAQSHKSTMAHPPSNSTIVKFGFLPNLEVLDFPADNLSTSGVDAIAKLENLRELKISGCKEVNLAPMFLKLKNLVMVDMTDCIVHDGTLMELVKNNPKLEQLNLMYGCRYSKAGITAIAQNCPKLQHLNLSGEGDLDQIDVRQVVEGCKELKYLWLDLKPSRFIDENTIRPNFIKQLRRENPGLEFPNFNF